jgi:xyloglucan-specific exo-beta-1,4-glucanase
LSTKTVTNITPPRNLPGVESYGFGGLAVDSQNPGTVMVAALNVWWPDGNIFRSTNGGATWTTLWDWNQPRVSAKKFYTFKNAIVPWLSPNYTVTTLDLKQIG